MECRDPRPRAGPLIPRSQGPLRAWQRTPRLDCIHYDQPDGAPPPRERYPTGGRPAAAPSKAHKLLLIQLLTRRADWCL